MPQTTAEIRLNEALKRLLNGKPKNVTIKGNLTLNLLNKEAGLGHSYIYKKQFEDFVKIIATPAIKEFNDNKASKAENLTDFNDSPNDELNRIKAELKRVEALKDKYRIERNDAIAAKELLESQFNNLKFRVFELQTEMKYANIAALQAKPKG